MNNDELVRDAYFGTTLICPICNSERVEQKVFVGRSSVWALVCECSRAK